LGQGPENVDVQAFVVRMEKRAVLWHLRDNAVLKKAYLTSTDRIVELVSSGLLLPILR
jgi:hypothetical protein